MAPLLDSIPTMAVPSFFYRSPSNVHTVFFNLTFSLPFLSPLPTHQFYTDLSR